MGSDVRPSPAKRQPDQAPQAGENVASHWSALPRLRLDRRSLAKARIVSETSNADAVPFDTLRTRLLHQMKTNGWRRVIVTSPGARCGKTTLCLNLAFSSMRLRDHTSIVVDFDMRRPAIAKTLKLDRRHDFSRVLEGKDPAEKHMVCYNDRLIFATNHSAVSNSAELLQERETGWVIDQIEEKYQPDLMIFDTPPMLVCDDTYAFLDQVDCVILIAEAGRTTYEEIDKCEREIAGRTNMLGIILNKCRYLGKADSYGY